MIITALDKDPGMEYFILELDDENIFDDSDKWGHDLYPEQIEWCRVTYGSEDFWGEPVVNGWKRMRNKFYFTKEDMRSLFILRWS
jgi:hypothetical protein